MFKKYIFNEVLAYSVLFLFYLIFSKTYYSNNTISLNSPWASVLRTFTQKQL